MEPACNLDNFLKILFQDHSYRNVSDIISVMDSKIKTAEISKNNCETLKDLGKIVDSIELLLQILNNNYEDKFNVFIEYIFDQIKNILLCGIHKDILSTLPLCSLISVLGAVFDISISHSCKGSMVKIADFYKCILSPLINNDNAISEEELTLRLRIISVFYEIVNKKIQCQSENIKQLTSLMTFDNCECNLFSRLIFNHSKVVAALTLLNIIPKFIECSQSNIILQYIWEEISKSIAQKDNNELSRKFVILCYLSNLYFTTNNKELISDILKCNHFWILLQNGLIHSDTSVRKQALFLIKTSCNFIKDHKVNSIWQDKDEKNCSKIVEKCDILMNWECDTNFTILKELCCIIEYLEEKQVHLLKPMIDVIESFISVHGQVLHISWMLIVIQRMITHDNMIIVRKGFLNMLNIPVCKYYNEEIMKHATKILVSCLNCTQLYIADWQVVDELKRYFNECSKGKNCKEFFNLLLNDICEVRWSPEALFFVTYSLQFVKSNKYWGKNDIDLIKRILNGTENHYTYIKSAIQSQLLNISINFMDSHVTLDNIAALLTCFTRKMCLQRGSILWKNLVKWIKDSYAAEDVEKFIENCINPNISTANIGKMILVIHDAYSDHQTLTCKIKNLLKNLSASFAHAHARPYSNKEAQEFHLSVIVDLMDESAGDSELLKILSPTLPDILLYIEMRLDSLHHIRDFQTSENFLSKLKTILNFCKNDYTITECISNWFEKIIRNLILEPVKFLPLQKFVQVKILTTIMVSDVRFVSHPKMEFVGPYLKTELCAPLEKTSQDLTLTKDLQTLWGKMNSEHLKRKWELLSFVSHSPVEALRIRNGEFLQLCLEAVDIGGSAVLLPLMNVLGKALPSLLSDTQLEHLMDKILNLMMEKKKNEDFYQLVQTFIQITFQQNVLESEDENIKKMLIDLSHQLFSENNVNAANIFVKHMQTLPICIRSRYFYLAVLPRALLFGQIQRKDERLINNICSVIEKENLSPLANDLSTTNEVRGRAIQIIASLKPGNKEHCQFAEDLIDALIKLEESTSKNKTRYFSDSHIHRCRERLMQSLLLLECYISKSKSEELWKLVCNKVILENNQPSVRYLQEWLMLRLLYHNPHLKYSLWKYFDEGLEKRTGSLCSLITIVHHSVMCLPAEEFESWIDKAVQTFLPYCMAQHFSVRLYAQVTLQKLMKLSNSLNLTSIVERYGIVSDSLSQSIQRGNAVKNCVKMQEDFYFTAFDPVEHFSLETIFHEFPRLTCVGSYECISPSFFQQCGINEANCSIPLMNKNDSLKSFGCGKWIVDGSKQVNLFEDSDDHKELELLNFQKKMIPIKCLVPDWEELLQTISYSPGDKNNKEGLVVVASLIDRLPNLGGLSRTCEVFGASELVIGSLKYLEDQQFKNLSVTAEKWIPITEVKPYHLSEYLMKMKENGYTILAAEQTINSQTLESYKFPKKSLLLLGNEKEGIPPTLLPLMDVCIEIPQKGIIRSLNVHVTGALFVWEYAKQHNLMNSKF